MIRIARPAGEPPALAAARQSALEALRPHGPQGRAELGNGYKTAHDTLWRAQHMKCCYCEAREQSKRNDVEHYRPAMRADRRPGSPATHGYWWLAFSWSNLLFSCRNCNESPAKLDKFPLDVGSEPLVAEQAPPGKERPLLIDPAAESGVDDIEFVRMTRADGVVQWRPRARAGSARGDRTIRTCMLDRPDLITLYTQHVALNVEPDLDAFDAKLASGDTVEITSAWRRLCARHLEPAQTFVGLSLDVLAARYPAATRQRWGLELPRR